MARGVRARGTGTRALAAVSAGRVPPRELLRAPLDGGAVTDTSGTVTGCGVAQALRPVEGGPRPR